MYLFKSLNDYIIQDTEEENSPDNNSRTQNHSENEKRMYDTYMIRIHSNYPI